MEIKAIIKTLMNQDGLKNAALAERLGLTAQAMWDRLNNKKHKSIGVDTAVDILKAMDYKLVVMPRGARMPEGAVEVGADK